jgi:alkylation response protein AidB-like acyl-CoA dehydrogenase
MRFSSGCDAASWILLLAPTHQCLVPKPDFRVEDDWYVSGLRGTGSKSIIIEDAFVPAHRMIPMERLATAQSPGRALYPDYPYYQVPFGLVLNTMLLSPTIGMAWGLLDLFTERALNRVDGHTGDKAYLRPGTQLRFGEASAKVECAALLLRRTLQSYEEWAASGELMPLSGRAWSRRNICYSAKLCVEAADLLLESGDASGQYDHQLVQRWGRDIHMAGLQMGLTWDEPAMSYSQVQWGLEPTSRFT